MTLSKLAQLANVSISVVSKAFSGRDDISDAMREHVFAVAREHGCFQQFYHVPYDKPVVAVIVPELISEYYVRFIEVLKRSMEESGYTMLLSISNFDRQLAGELTRYYTAHGKVDGLLLLTPVDELPAHTSTAIVSLGRYTPDERGACISLEPATGIAAALAYLKELGHTRIAYVGEHFTHTKRTILADELEKAGLTARPEWLVTSFARFEEAGRDGVRRIWSQAERPTAIFGAYGYITRGILQELEDMGLRVPEDVSVISMDNQPSPLSATRDVTCIPSEIEQSCAMALELLKQRIHSADPNAPYHCQIPTTLHKGKTVKHIKEGR